MVAPYTNPPSSAGCSGTAPFIPGNGICERFHRTILNEFYRVAFRKKLYQSIEELQEDLDLWIEEYNSVSYCPISLCA